MKTAGIITYFGENYGACLQAYAVQETIKSFGYETEIINYLPLYKETNLQKMERRIPYIMNPNRYIKYFQNRYIKLKYRDQLYKRSFKFQMFIKNHLNITVNKYNDILELKNAEFDYDVYITGSDQIWNTSHHRCNPVYFLDFAPEEKKKIAFAPSIARMNIQDEFKDQMSVLLSKMDYISVREDVNIKTVKDLVPHKEVVHVLDPTFMLNRGEWDKIVGAPMINEKYIFCYLFGDLEYVEVFVNHIKNITGYKVISMPYNIRELRRKDVKVIFDAGPNEFVNLIRNAEIIITDSFHATAFSINYNKPFYTLLRQDEKNPDNMNSRFFSILKLVGLEDRLILPENELPKEICLNIDFENVNEKLEKAKHETIEYLKRSLR